ncbi:MAG: rubrerythrin family protein [bacterium]|nr:rubrerythrin family protein [bacterium]
MDDKLKKKILASQKSEITEYHIYKKLAKRVKNEENREILERIAHEEHNHYKMWKKYTGKEVKPSKLKIWKYYIISRLLGLSFGLKLMEKEEKIAQASYLGLGLEEDEIKEVIKDEKEHEMKLLGMLNEDFLQYTSSMVLGLNDALVELTGALAGFTLALKNTKLIALVGLITGIAASLSMASSEYLATKAEDGSKNPVKAAIYTGIAYLFTVLVLISPYIIFTNYYICLTFTMVAAILIILVFNYYISVAKEQAFWRHFLEMVILSLGIAALSFGIGHLLRSFLGVDV